MKAECPVCQRELKSYKERRYIDGRFRERVNINHTVLYHYECKGKRGNRHDLAAFLLLVEVPKDKELAPVVEYSQDWDKWRRAQKSKPGKAFLGTTESQFTVFVHSNPADIYEKLLRRPSCPPPAKKQTA